jgi:predicted anti-sigma-YlaC factor YlaD
VNELGHISRRQLDRYAGGEPAAADVLWALEAHLEACPGCRARLGDAVARHSPDTAALLVRVQERLAIEVARSRQMPAPRRWRRSAAPALLPRIAMAVLVILVAFGLDVADRVGGGTRPSMVLLVAPVAPLLGVMAAWSRALDPAYEMVVASPRAGLYLILRRTLAALGAVIPLLFVAGGLVGASPARWLLPCLAFTAGALALGEVVGLHRAAGGLVLLWVLLVIGPSVLTSHSPALLAPASLPVWAALGAAVTAVLLLRRGEYTTLHSGR